MAAGATAGDLFSAAFGTPKRRRRPPHNNRHCKKQHRHSSSKRAEYSQSAQARSRRNWFNTSHTSDKKKKKKKKKENNVVVPLDYLVAAKTALLSNPIMNVQLGTHANVSKIIHQALSHMSQRSETTKMTKQVSRGIQCLTVKTKKLEKRHCLLFCSPALLYVL